MNKFESASCRKCRNGTFHADHLAAHKYQDSAKSLPPFKYCILQRLVQTTDSSSGTAREMYPQCRLNGGLRLRNIRGRRSE